jgi:hypothetical protein
MFRTPRLTPRLTRRTPSLSPTRSRPRLATTVALAIGLAGVAACSTPTGPTPARQPAAGRATLVPRMMLWLPPDL